MISRRELAEVIAERTLDVRDASVLAKEVAAYLLESHHTADVESLIRDIMELRAQKGIVEAVAVSAYELNDEVIADIKRILKEEYPNAKSVHVIRKIDPNVVGGVRVEMANERLDMTVRDKIDTFKRLTATIKE
jgi:F0F1-type ATP synthase delta subunit